MTPTQTYDHRTVRAARSGFGVFYLAMAGGVNARVFLPRAKEALSAFSRDAWLPMYHDVLESVVVPNARTVMTTVIILETATGVTMLAGSDRAAAVAMLAGTAWCVGLLPVLRWPHIAVMPPLIAAQLWLFARLRSRSPRS